jgi:hypothetical protein
VKTWSNVFPLLLLSCILLAVYTFTLLPGIGYFGDTCKFQFIGTILGTAHEPGEPLYTVLTSVFGKIFPFGTTAWKVNYFSALMAVLSICGLYVTMVQVGIQRVIAWGFSLSAGLMYTFWSQAVIAEVYALNAAFVSWILYLYIRWYRTGDINYFYLGTFCYALSFGNHVSMITFLPALLFFVFLVNRKMFTSRHVVSIVLLFILAGAMQYGYLIHRYYTAPPGVYMEIAAGDLKTLWYYVSGGQFHGELFPLKFSSMMGAQGSRIGKYLLRELSFFIPLVLYGIYVLSKDYKVAWLLLLSILGNMTFALGYTIFDIYVYLIPAYLISAIFAAIGFDSATQKFSLPLRAGMAAIIFPAIFFTVDYPYANQHSNTEIEYTVDRALADADSNAVIFSQNYTYGMALWYKYYCEGWKERNIHILYAEQFSSGNIIANYLKGISEIPVERIRSTIPLGLKVFVLTSFNKQYLEYGPLKDPTFDSTLFHYFHSAGKELINEYRQRGLSTTERFPDFYEISLPPKQVLNRSRL